MTSRVIIEGRIRFDAPFAVGSGDFSPLTDRPVGRDDDGQPQLTASGVAGALRSLGERLAPFLRFGSVEGPDALVALFGEATDDEAPASAEGGTRRGRASLLSVDDPCPCGRVGADIRDGVGIDRASGSAREAIKYDFEVADLGARYSLRMELATTGGEDAAAGLLKVLLDEWQAGRLALGGRTSSGLGATTLENIDAHQLQLTRRDLRQWLRARPSPSESVPAGDGGVPERTEGVTLAPTPLAGAPPTWVLPGHRGPAPGWFSITMRLSGDGPLLVAGSDPVPAVADDDAPGSSRRVDESDAQPLTRRRADGTRIPVAPGSSIKGVLRARCERIARTIGGTAAACDPFDHDPASRHCSCGKRPLGEAFDKEHPVAGRSPRERGAEERARAAALQAEHSCPVCRLFGNERLGGRLSVAEAELTGPPALVDHVAVDRFTGGVADTRKFDAAPVLFPGTEVSVRIDWPEPRDVALVLLAVRDVVEGWVPIGSRGSRGYGGVRGAVTSLEWAAPAPPAATGTGTGAPGASTNPGLWHRRRWVPPAAHFLGSAQAWDLDGADATLSAAVGDGLQSLRTEAERWAGRVQELVASAAAERAGEQTDAEGEAMAADKVAGVPGAGVEVRS